MPDSVLDREGVCMGKYNLTASCLLVDGRDYYRAFFEAAMKARRYIFIAGWQLHSKTELLRGDDRELARRNHAPVRFLEFLSWLCLRRPELEIFVLAWDFNPIYVLDREMFQKWLFRLKGNDRIHYVMDALHPIGASHHQKLVVIDGSISFLGGLDFATDRWDTRSHRMEEPGRRNKKGKPYEAYHDMQCCLEGEVSGALAELFRERWELAGGKEMDLPGLTGIDNAPVMRDLELQGAMYIESGKVGISRTMGRTLSPPTPSVQEIRALFMHSVESAERLIYIENQYFSSSVFYNALLERFRDRNRPALEVVLVLPKDFHSGMEKVALGMSQQRMLHNLLAAAGENGHKMGIYYRTATPPDGHEEPVYIHSKLIIVDDRLISVGSANISNRSMGLDSELNAIWEDRPGADSSSSLVKSIRNIRLELLAEHTGASASDIPEEEGLVEFLNSKAGSSGSQLRKKDITDLLEEIELLRDVPPEDLALDPEEPLIPEDVFESYTRAQKGLTGAVARLFKRLTK